jgi:hypothetical protein
MFRGSRFTAVSCMRAGMVPEEKCTIYRVDSKAF